LPKWVKDLFTKNPRSLTVVGVFFGVALIGALIAYASSGTERTRTSIR
jgi:hypothetical protein